MTSAVASSSAKLIISGEHSVVYGHWALALPLPIKLTVKLSTSQAQNKSDYLQHLQNICANTSGCKFPNLKIEISSQIPQNSGFGSSATLAHAFICAYMQLCDLKLSTNELFKLVLTCEKFHHSNPSGVDPAVIIHQMPLVFTKKGSTFSPSFKSNSFFPLSACTILNSGPASESTGEMVAHVFKHPHRDQIIKQIGDITQKLLDDLDNHQEPWELITKNQRLLEKLDVVSPGARKIVSEIEALGGFAKICGAGGIKTGSGAILAYHRDKKILLKHILEKNWHRIY